MKRVLIVEDQEDIRELIRLTLELEDFDIHEADNGDAGLALAQAVAPDVMLLDVMMPGRLDGIAVCREIKADPDMQKIKVVILSAKGQESDRLQGQQAGADGYLTKPFSPKQLLSVVTQFTD